MEQGDQSQETINNIENESQENWEWNDELQKVEKKYQVVSSIIFKYWILIITIIATITLFFVELQKRKTLSFDNKYEARKFMIVWQYNKEEAQSKNQNLNLNVILRQWFLNITDDVIQSYNNLLNYKWYTLPRWTFLYEPNEIKNIEYFKNPDYEITELQKVINKIIYINYNEVWARDNKDIMFIPLENNSIENTFYITCANQHRFFNWVCNKYINDFLDWFFVYKISDDFKWFNKTFKNIIKRKKYKEQACNWLNNYIKYSGTTPNEIEWLFSLCWNEYVESFNKMQSFIELKKDLEDKYIKQNISKYKELNEYKLVSYQQILYNNLENSIPPYEWSYKNYTNYLINILKRESQDPIDPFYYDLTYRFNNQYLIPNLNKIKYQSTQSKRDEIEWIILEIEKVNNWNNIDWFKWLKYKLTSNKLENEISKIGSNISNENDNTINALLKSIKSLSYIKIINDEISWNLITINGYLSLNTSTWERTPTPFKSTLENKKWKLIVNEFTLSVKWESLEINNILKIILQQKDYSIWEVYEYIQKNIKIYESNKYNITPCILIKDRLENLNIEWAELLNCNEQKINIIKWWSWNKILYQITMDSYQITSIKVTDKDIQSFVDKNLSWVKTNATTITTILPNLIAYEPKKSSNTLIWSNDAITAIDDLKTYLWVNLNDIWERNWRVAAEFSINDLNLIWVYDTNTKILWPIFLTGISIWTWKENPIINNFYLRLTQDNQNEINKFLIEPIGYLYELDQTTIKKYLPEKLEEYLTKK